MNPHATTSHNIIWILDRGWRERHGKAAGRKGWGGRKGVSDSGIGGVEERKVAQMKFLIWSNRRRSRRYRMTGLEYYFMYGGLDLCCWISHPFVDIDLDNHRSIFRLEGCEGSLKDKEIGDLILEVVRVFGLGLVLGFGVGVLVHVFWDGAGSGWDGYWVLGIGY